MASDSSHRSQSQEILSPEEKAELGFLVSAIQDLLVSLGTTRELIPPLRELISNLIHTALLRAKPDRRLAYLNQWRQFLCSLPEFLSRHETAERISVMTKAVTQFRLQDQRGKRKPPMPIPTGTNCLLERRGFLWFGRIPDELRGAENADIKREYFVPLNQPGVLKAEYTRLNLDPDAVPADYEQRECLPAAPEREDEGVLAQRFAVPRRLLHKWLVEGVTREELALLIAAHRAGLTARHTNLNRLRQTLKYAT